MLVCHPKGIFIINCAGIPRLEMFLTRLGTTKYFTGPYPDERKVMTCKGKYCSYATHFETPPDQKKMAREDIYYEGQSGQERMVRRDIWGKDVNDPLRVFTQFFTGPKGHETIERSYWRM